MLSVMKPLRWLLALTIVLFIGQAFGHGMSEAEKLSIIEGGNLRYMWLVSCHTLNVGYNRLSLTRASSVLNCQFTLA